MSAGEAVPMDPGVLRDLAPGVLAALVRKHGHFDICEDAVQEALVAATVQWPGSGMPRDPRAWLLTVASRRLTDRIRSDSARRRREETVGVLDRVDGNVDDSADAATTSADDTLLLLFLCCHPALTPQSQIALTLRAVGGLTTAEIAAAFLVPDATMAQRISRAKQAVRRSGVRFEMPPSDELDERLAVVLHVLYLVFNEGYAATSGPDLVRVELTAEAIRLTRAVHRQRPDDGEVAGLLALMLLTDARRPARVTDDGSLVSLAEQDRSLWDTALVAEGIALVTDSLAHRRLGPYQIQAAIAAVHAEAPTSEATDWAQIVALYGVLDRVAPNPIATLNHAVAVAMAHGPSAGLAMLADVETDGRLAGNHRVDAVRGYLLEMAGETDAAINAYRAAARRTASVPERRYLDARARRLAQTRGW